VDDVVDEVPDVGVARTKLAWWRTEVANLFAGHPQHPVTKALAPFTKTHGIDAGRMNEIIDGMEMDLVYHRYPDFESLRLYCHRAAGVVGQLSASIFGYSNPATLEYAENLGIAFQLTNIIRDVGEDARRGRVYLPQDELARFGLTAEGHPRAQGRRALRAPHGIPGRESAVVLRPRFLEARGARPREPARRPHHGGHLSNLCSTRSAATNSRCSSSASRSRRCASSGSPGRRG
jgi:hypothetical protein